MVNKQRDLFFGSMLRSACLVMGRDVQAKSKIWDRLEFYKRMEEIWGDYEAHVRVKAYQGIWLW